MNNTICAISSANGNGAIALIRLSGEDAISITDKVFKSKRKGFELAKQKSQTIHFGEIIIDNMVVDEVVVSLFKAPKTYTGEDVVEISCHGSIYIQQQILHALIKNGASLAQPGEFTQRAYLNGKMDLSQAEAVSDVIASSNKVSHQIAMNQMRGGFSSELKALRDELLQFTALIELELDFSEEDVEFADRTKLLELIEKIETIILRLIQSFELGNAIKNGVPVAIVGEPNVGKSTLLNAILNEDKAIVSDIAGTTRDSIEDTFNYKGVTFRFIDTAGLRETTDAIESIGIERTYQKIDQAKIVLALFDAIDPNEKVANELENIFAKSGEDKHLILVRNKADKVDNNIEPLSDSQISAQVNLSAKENQNVDLLLEKIGEVINLDSIDQDQVIVSNVRHLEALSLAMESLNRAKEGMNAGITNDFLAMDVRETIHHLAGITGEEISTDEVLGHIFGQFCIGK